MVLLEKVIVFAYDKMAEPGVVQYNRLDDDPQFVAMPGSVSIAKIAIGLCGSAAVVVAVRNGTGCIDAGGGGRFQYILLGVATVTSRLRSLRGG